jgi:hypothetical protein
MGLKHDLSNNSWDFLGFNGDLVISMGYRYIYIDITYQINPN